MYSNIECICIVCKVINLKSISILGSIVLP